jgi:hypothetical protein
MHDMAALVAGELELGGGLPCGGCGKPHASSVTDWQREGARLCDCPCCLRHFHDHIEEIFREDFPDLIEHRRGGDVITEAAVDEAIRRLKRSLAENAL